MALFRRRPVEPVVPDDHLHFLSAEDAARLRMMVAAAFAERGLEVAVHPGHVEDAQGRQFGLWNVAAACAHEGRSDRAWRREIGRHVDRVLASLDGPDPLETMDDDELRSRVLVRLAEEASLPDPDRFPHVEFVPGVVQVLALDLPETVQVLDSESVTRLGGWQQLQGVGRENLHAERVDEVAQVDAPGGSSFTVLLGDSVHTASRALLLPGLLTELGEADAPHGWLLAVPNRHQLVLHVVRDLSVVGAVNGMARFAALGHDDAPGPLSPDVHWWHGSGYQQLTRTDDDGLHVQVDERFGAVLEQLPPAP